MGISNFSEDKRRVAIKHISYYTLKDKVSGLYFSRYDFRINTFNQENFDKQYHKKSCWNLPDCEELARKLILEDNLDIKDNKVYAKVNAVHPRCYSYTTLLKFYNYEDSPNKPGFYIPLENIEIEFFKKREDNKFCDVFRASAEPTKNK